MGTGSKHYLSVEEGWFNRYEEPELCKVRDCHMAHLSENTKTISGMVSTVHSMVIM